MAVTVIHLESQRPGAPTCARNPQLALDTAIAPAWALPRQWLHELPHLIRCGRSPATFGYVLSLDHSPAPGQQGARRHDPVQAEVTGQQPAEWPPGRARRAASATAGFGG